MEENETTEESQNSESTGGGEQGENAEQVQVGGEVHLYSPFHSILMEMQT